MDPLEFLAESNGCMISDLYGCCVTQYNFSPLLTREPEEFTVFSWNALLEYMFPGSPVFQTQTQAHDYLAERIKNA